MTRATGTRRWLLAGGALLLLPVAAACGDARFAGHPTGEVATAVEAGGSNPTVSLDGEGRGYVAWVGADGDDYNVYLAVSEPGADGFGAPVRVNDQPGDAAPHDQAPAQVVSGGEGRVYVLWQNNTRIEGRRFPASDLRFVRSEDGGRTFHPAVTVNDDIGDIPASHTFHAMDVAADGTIIVSWIDSRVQTRARADATTSEELAAADAIGPEIRFALSRDDGRTFSPSLVVDGNSCPCCRTAITSGPDGRVYIAWRKIFEGEVRDIVVATLEPGADAFGPPVRVHEDDWVFPGCPHAGPAMATDADGRLHVAWYTGRDDRQGIWYTVSEDGGASFAGATPLLDGEWVPPSIVGLATTSEGLWMAWEDRTVEPASVSFLRTPPGAKPGGMSAFEAGAGRLPDMASNVRGDVLAAWVEGESVRAQRLGPTR